MSQKIQAGATYVELFVRDNKLSEGLRAASARIKKWAADTKKQMQSIGKSLMSFGVKGLGVGAGIGGGLLAMAKSFADTGDAIEKMSHRTGMSAEVLSELGYAAQQCGTDIGTVEKSIKQMQMLMHEAGQGSQIAIDKLTALGLSYKQLAKLSPEEQFAAIIDRLGQMDEASRAAHAMDILGQSARQLMPLINAGADGIAEMRAEARRLGVSMSTQDAKAATALSDAFTRLQVSMKSIVRHIGAALAPSLTRLAKWTVAITSSIVKLINSNRAMIVMIAKISLAVAAIGSGLIVAGAAFVGLGAVAGTALAGISLALKAVAGLAAFLVSPIGIACTAIGGLLWYFGVIGKTIEWLKDTWSSLFSTATKAWAGIKNAIAAGRIDLAMKVAWTGIKLVWKDGINFLHRWWLWIQNKIMTTWDATVHGLTQAYVNAFIKPLVDAFPEIHLAWRQLTKSMGDIWWNSMYSIVGAWDWVQTKITKGLAWIFAKLNGLDAEAVVGIVEEDHRRRIDNRKRDQLNIQQHRDAEFKKDVAEMVKFSAAEWLHKKQEEGDAEYALKQNARQEAYDAQLAQMQFERLQAENEFNNAVAEAISARVDFEKDAVASLKNERFPDMVKAIEESIVDNIEDAIEMISGSSASRRSVGSHGTFDARAIRGLGREDHSERIANNTEQTVKILKQQTQMQRKGMPAIAK